MVLGEGSHMKGKLIVIDGADGSGKTTQLSLLQEYLKNKKIPVETVDFPRYYDSFYGKMIARFLQGEFGKLAEVNPYLISVIYAADRAMAASEMYEWLGEGKIILANRYATSNLAHQAFRLSKGKRKAFIDWDLELEYEVNKIPKEDIVIYLYGPNKISLKLLRNKDRSSRSYTKGKRKDMVERDRIYLKNSEEAYLTLVKKFPHWIKINCVDKKGELKSKEAIHKEVVQALVKKKIIS
jgi:dTMP kinase